MDMSEELLARYFRSECSSEEKLSVINYLKQVDQLPENLLPQEDWDDVDEAIISTEKSDEMFAVIQKQIISKTLTLNRLKLVSAAAIIFVTFTIGLIMLNKTDPNFNVAKTKVTIKENKAQIVWKSFVNYTNHNQTLKLPDGSTVKVYPRGKLRYAIPFIKHSREIYLEGKSFFQVAKDKKHPFIVYSKEISTTALGTSFTVTATENSSLTKVELHTGKVWIKNVFESKNTLSFNKILLPGNELVYNSIKHQVKVRDKNLAPKELPGRNELNFTQASLKDVFEKLIQYYKIKITYNDTDLDNISFTGSINLDQKAEKILKEICELNKLNQTKTSDGYIISKQKK